MRGGLKGGGSGRAEDGDTERHAKRTKDRHRLSRAPLALLCQDFGREAVSLGPKAEAGEKDLQQRKELF